MHHLRSLHLFVNIINFSENLLWGHRIRETGAPEKSNTYSRIRSRFANDPNGISETAVTGDAN